ncbi:hypothetical protein C5167_022575, partial [Papaver somniferum]
MGSDKKRRDIPAVMEEELRLNWECMMPEQTETHRHIMLMGSDKKRRDIPAVMFLTLILNLTNLIIHCAISVQDTNLRWVYSRNWIRRYCCCHSGGVQLKEVRLVMLD